MTGSFSKWLLPWLGSIVLVFVCACCEQRAGFRLARFEHELDRGSSNGFFGSGSYFGGGSTYLPFGGGMGGFVPYSARPGGGLGVMQGMSESETPNGVGKDVHAGHEPRSGPDRRQPHASGTNRTGPDDVSGRRLDGLDGRRLDQAARVTRRHGRHGPPTRRQLSVPPATQPAGSVECRAGDVDVVIVRKPMKRHA